MQSPKKVKYRKQQKLVKHIKRNATRGYELAFGSYGIMALESSWLSNRVIEAGRVAIARTAKRGGKLWIRVFADKPLTKKPAEVRMGKGKGSPESWVAEIQPGRIVYELTGVDRETAYAAYKLASSKLPFKTKFIEQKDTIL